MERHIMVELYENVDVLNFIEGFSLDKNYKPIQMNNREAGKDTFLFRGKVTNNEATHLIEQLPNFYALWDDAPIGPAGGFGPARFYEGPKELIAGKITELSEKGEFELFLLFHENKGKKVGFYRKWVNKMEEGKTLAKPVYQKLIRELGDEFHLDKTEEVLNLYNTILDKSKIKNFD